MLLKRIMPIFIALLAIFVCGYAFAAGKPEITSQTVQYLDRALSVNVQWQSENPITRVKVIAGQGVKEIQIDEYDNRRNPSGYQGEVSVVIPVEPKFLQTSIPYQIQLEDDLRQKSELFSGLATPPAGTMTSGVPGGVGVGIGVGVGGVGVGVGVGVGMGVGMPAQPGAQSDDHWGKDHIRAGKGQGESSDGKSNDMVDKLLKVAERFDTPPSLDVIKIHVLGPENVSFSSIANDDKGLKEITFRVYDAAGNKAGEQVLTNLGKKWEASTQPIKLTNGGNYRVVAQAVDTAGNTSKEQSTTFAMKGTPPPTTLIVNLQPQDAVAAGAQWQLDGGAWLATATSITATPGKHKLAFKDATGWVLPTPQDIDIKEGPNTANGTYTVPAPKNGTVTVTLLTADAIKAGAQWQLDGAAWQNSDVPVTTPPGKHRIAFKDVAGWTTPPQQDLDVKEGDNKISATYAIVAPKNDPLPLPTPPVPVPVVVPPPPAPKTGTLAVSLLPADAVKAGAQWQVDGGEWQTGASATLTIGKHKLTFKDVSSWNTPQPQEIEIKEGANQATATYSTKSGTLTVTLLPSDISKTAQWMVDGGAPQADGATATAALGKHTITFKSVDGWTPPAAQEITVIEGVNKATATYTAQKGTLVVTIVPAAAASAGAQWRVGTGAWQNSGAQASLPAGSVSVEFKDVAGWVKPGNLNATIVTSKQTDSSVAYGKNFTTNQDFESGQLIGLEDQTVKDQLQLSKSSSTLPFIWVPNSNNGTISKVDSKTGDELGRYYTGPTTGGSPSRTTVDLKGNCLVGNRNTGTVVKVGLVENGQCVDRNKNGKIETSTGATPLAWGDDECVLFEVILDKGRESTQLPLKGAAAASNGSGPRGIAVDKNNNVWAGTYNSRMFYYIDGTTGAILQRVDTSSKSHGSYGAVIDQSGVIWSADINNRNVLRLDPSTGSVATVALGHMAYGIGIDKSGHLFVAGWTDNQLARINTATAQKEWSKSGGASGLRGVAVTNDGDVWTANSYSNSVTRWSNDGVVKATIPGFSHPTGVATDAEGKVWVVDYNSSNIYRINPATNQIDLSKAVGGSGHYGYSDMTGIVARSTTTKLGTWTSTLDGGATTNWNTVSWNGQESANAVIKVRARVSADSKAWSNWEDVSKNSPLKSAINGRYIQLETTMQLVSGEASPILTDLVVTAKP